LRSSRYLFLLSRSSLSAPPSSDRALPSSDSPPPSSDSPSPSPRP